MSVLSSISGVANSGIGAIPVVGNVTSIIGGAANLLGGIFGGGKPKTPKDIAYANQRTYGDYKDYLATGNKHGYNIASRGDAEAWIANFDAMKWEAMVALSMDSSLANTNEWYVEAATGFNANPQLLINARADYARRQAAAPAQSYNPATNTGGVLTGGIPATVQTSTMYVLVGLGVVVSALRSKLYVVFLGGGWGFSWLLLLT
jgi:hypothetical protein